MNKSIHIHISKSTLHFRLVLFLLIYQSLGVHIFSGIGFLLSFICLAVLLKYVRLERNQLLLISFLSLCAASFQLLKGTQLSYVLNTVLHIINVSLAVIHYKANPWTFRKDLEAVLFIFALHALISIPFDFFLPDGMLWDIKDTNHHYRGTFLYLFFFCDQEFVIQGFSRLNGLAWEPGCLQLLLNIYLLMGISSGKSIKQLLWIIGLIIFTGSTTGYLILLINLLVLGSKYIKKHFVFVVFAGVVVVLLFSPLVLDNLTKKFAMNYGNLNGSAIVRARDFLTGILAITKHPFFGIDMSGFASSKVFSSIEHSAISMIPGAESWYDFHDVNASGYTNGFFSVFLQWGIIGLLFHWLFFKSSAWKLLSVKYRYLFPIIFLISLMAEPLSNTPLFDIFILYEIFTKVRFSI